MNRYANHKAIVPDMIEGPLASGMIKYAVPILLSSLIQLFFNAADVAVVGRFSGPDALAAVSASGPVANLVIQLFIGMSVGANVLCAQFDGGRKRESFEKAVHTAITVAALCGIFLMLAGMLVAKPVLRLSGAPAEILPLSALYLRIYFVGVPFSLVYNFGAAILRSVGDTRKPLQYLTIAGALNVVLNVFFVAALGMGVAGVATATAVSQATSATLVIRDMLRTDRNYRLDPKKLHIDTNILLRMLGIGIPAGIQNSSFSIANLLIQSAVNSFGSTVMAASAIALSIESFCFVGVEALGQAALTFTGQNYGAGNYKRIGHILRDALAMELATGIALGDLAYFLAPWLMRIYTTDPEVMAYAREIMFIVCVFGFITCFMSVPFNILRGINHSVYPMICTILLVCVLRVVWVLTVFAHFRTLTVLYMAWPVTKACAGIAGFIGYFIYYRRLTGKPVR